MAERVKVEVRSVDFASAAEQEALLAILEAFMADPATGGAPLAPGVRDAIVPGLRTAGACCLLAWNEGQAVGAAVCLPSFSTFKARPVLNLHDMAVVDGHRGRGIGRQLLAAVEAEARARGCCKITLEVRDDNDTARHLYDRFGFGQVAEGVAQSPTWFLEKGLSS